MMTKGIAPRPEQEILYEMKVFDEMKGKIDKDTKKEIKQPKTLEEYKAKLL